MVTEKREWNNYVTFSVLEPQALERMGQVEQKAVAISIKLPVEQVMQSSLLNCLNEMSYYVAKNCIRPTTSRAIKTTVF